MSANSKKITITATNVNFEGVVLDIREKMGNGVIAIHCNPERGSGDIAYATKIADFFLHQVGISSEQLVILAPEKANSLRGRGYNVKPLAEKVERLCLQIIVPGEVEFAYLSRQVPTVHVYELGWNSRLWWEFPWVKEVLIGREKLEILPEPSLLSAKIVPPEKRIENLKEASDSLQKVLKGASSIFLGYATRMESYEGFVKGIARHHVGDLTFVLPTYKPKHLPFSENVVVDRFEKETGAVNRLSSTEKPGRQIRILTGGVDQKDFYILIRSVFPFIMVTGDHSLFEVISSRSTGFIYEETGHKERVARFVAPYVLGERDGAEQVSRVYQLVKSKLTMFPAQSQQIIDQSTAFERLQDAVKEVLGVEAMLDDLRKVNDITPGSIALGRTAMITLDQLLRFGISTHTNQIVQGPFKEDWSEWKFNVYCVGDATFLIRRFPI